MNGGGPMSCASGDASTASDVATRCSSARRPARRAASRAAARDRPQPRRDAERRGDAPHEIGRRHGLAVGDRATRRAAASAAIDERRDRVPRDCRRRADRAGCRSRRSGSDARRATASSSARKLPLHAGTVDERQPQDDRRHRRAGARAPAARARPRPCSARRHPAARADRRRETGGPAAVVSPWTLIVLASTKRCTPARTAARASRSRRDDVRRVIARRPHRRAVSRSTCARPARWTTAQRAFDRGREAVVRRGREIAERRSRLAPRASRRGARTSARDTAGRWRRDARTARGRRSRRRR